MFEIHKMVIPVTLRCNLKCKNCINDVPYFEPVANLTLEQFEKDIDMLFKIADCVGKFELTGGEPFLRNDLNNFIKAAVKYREKIKWIRIDTNGTIPIRDELIEEMKKHGDFIEVFISDYGEISRYAEQNEKLLIENDLKCLRRKYHGEDAYFGGWISNGAVLKRDRNNKEHHEVFKSCTASDDINGCLVYFNGTIHLCARSLQGTLHDVIPSIKNVDYLDVHTENMTLDEKRQVLKNMFSCEYIKACEYCNGNLGTDDVSKRVIPAEQL